MNAKEFKLWRKANGLSQTGAARKLGLKIRTIQYYEKGKRSDRSVEIPKAVALACFAISCGVEDVDYSEPEGRAVRPDRRDLLTPKE
jgi:transcriptional regulator with XRE-family HTH domain